MSLALIALGFAAGSIPFGVVLARRRGVDIQDHGSGNIGATNVARVLGARAGAIVLVLDAAKGALPVALAAHGYGRGEVAALTGAGAILGHCFSPWLGGKGGKGVATALGVFGVLAPWATAVGVGVFGAVFAATRVPALGSLAGIAAIALALTVTGAGWCAVLGIAVTGLLVYTHRGNLARLLRAYR